MHMNKINLFSKNEKELKILKEAERIYGEDIGVEFDTEKCAIFEMTSGKRHMTEGIKLPNQEKSEFSEKRKLTSTWKYWKWTPSNKRR